MLSCQEHHESLPATSATQGVFACCTRSCQQHHAVCAQLLQVVQQALVQPMVQSVIVESHEGRAPGSAPAPDQIAQVGSLTCLIDDVLLLLL